MAKPTVTSQQKIARIRGKLLRQSEKGLMKIAGSQERKLNNYVLNNLLPELDISGGQIKNTTANLRKINRATGLKAFIKKVVNVFMFGYYDKQFDKLEGATTDYFSPFEPTAPSQKRILDRGKEIVNGFVDSLFDNNQIVRGIQNTIRNGITSEQKVSELKAFITEQIKGKETKLGIVSNYHSVNGRDQFQAYSRSLDEEFSKNLGLNYAIYAGGTINDTREFCLDRNGQVFNRETILEWNTVPANWQGRKPNNNILIDMGGFNCRHDFDWISFALAKRINPEIEKSSFDKK